MLPPDCRQCLLCLSHDWPETTGLLYRFVREAADTVWHDAGAAFPVQLGRNGMGWGLGTHPLHHLPPGPEKQEGDDRTPAGIFRLGEAFGRAPLSTARTLTRLPYHQATTTHCYVDDPASRHYNRLMDTAHAGTVPDWQSAETLLRDDSRYDWGIVIRHNHDQPRPGRGSCIFMHLWQDAHTPTAGCTALSRQDMNALLGWLDPALQPCLVQLPLTVYPRLQVDWQLPYPDSNRMVPKR